MTRTGCRWLVVHVTLIGAVVFGAISRFDALYAGQQQERPHATAKVSLFETNALPLLRAKCLRYHGDKAKKAELDLRTRAGILKGNESGPVVQLGEPQESPLYEMVHGGKMPPGKTDKLFPAEVESIRRWIEAGAHFNSDHVSDSSTTITQHDALPILLRRYTICHGPRRQEASLDLRSRAAMLRGGKSGTAIVVGKPEQSLLLKKIRLGEMPPRRRIIEVSIKPIEAAETELLTRWIALGAPEGQQEPEVANSRPDPLVTDKDRDFWAFQPPHADTPPVVKQPDIPARARAVIHLFMNGGPSQLDLFDPKPMLDKQHGKPYFDRSASTKPGS